MATLTQIKGKTKTRFEIQFTGPDKKRRTISIPAAYTKRQAEEIRNMVSKIVNCQRSGRELEYQDQVWLESISTDLQYRFEKAGLVDISETTNFELWDSFMEAREGDIKESSLRTYETARLRYLRYFDPDQDPSLIRMDQVKDFRESLCKEYANATVAATIQRVRTVFNWAMKEGFVKENLFLKIKRGSFVNKENEVEITRKMYEDLLTNCPNQNWRTLLALCRIGGLRNPSETRILRWENVNWEKQRIWVTSPKTDHHNGKDGRWIPMFQELERELTNQFAMSDSEYETILEPSIFDNMRKVFELIIFRAGLIPWPRLFHNLRGSRSNELFRDYPAITASLWLGQSTRTATAHYLHVNDQDWKRATLKISEESKEAEEQRGQYMSKEVLSKDVQKISQDAELEV